MKPADAEVGNTLDSRSISGIGYSYDRSPGPSGCRGIDRVVREADTQYYVPAASSGRNTGE